MTQSGSMKRRSRRPRSSSTRWSRARPARRSSISRIAFEASGASTRVRVVHSGWERLGVDAADTRASYASGWPTVLGELYRGYCTQAADGAN